MDEYKKTSHELGCYLKNKVMKLWNFMYILKSIVYLSKTSVKGVLFLRILRIVPCILYIVAIFVKSYYTSMLYVRAF